MSYEPNHFDESETPQERRNRLGDDDGIRDMKKKTPGHGLRYMVYEPMNGAAWVVADIEDTVDVREKV